MMRTATLALAALALCTALPTEHDVVPETSLVEEVFDAHAEAVKAINLLQTKEGKDDSACRDLADQTKKEVDDSVDTQQKIIDGLDDGSECPNSGMDALRKAQAAKAAAEEKLTSAQASEAAASLASVDFGSYVFSSLTEGECGQFFADGSYVNAKATWTAATRARTKAEGEVTAATEALTAAEEAQKRAVQKCQCAVRDAEAKAWEGANADNDQDAKAYAKAGHMLCVLNDTPVGNCVTAPAPTVTRKVLAAGVASADCNTAPVFIGCYTDDGSRDFAAGPKQYGYNPTTCEAACPSFKYIALQNGGWCNCDNTYSTPPSQYPKRPDGECNTGGTGQGGPWRNAIYSTGGAPPEPEEEATPGQSADGCWPVGSRVRIKAGSRYAGQASGQCGTVTGETCVGKPHVSIKFDNNYVNSYQGEDFVPC